MQVGNQNGRVETVRENGHHFPQEIATSASEPSPGNTLYLSLWNCERNTKKGPSSHLICLFPAVIERGCHSTDFDFRNPSHQRMAECPLLTEGPGRTASRRGNRGNGIGLVDSFWMSCRPNGRSRRATPGSSPESVSDIHEPDEEHWRQEKFESASAEDRLPQPEPCAQRPGPINLDVTLTLKRKRQFAASTEWD